MAKKTAKKEVETKEKETVTFNCPACNQRKPVEEMRPVRRFFPMLVVCRDCERLMR